MVCVDECSEGGLNFSWEAELSRQRNGKKGKKAIPICIKSFIINTTCGKAFADSPATISGCQRILKYVDRRVSFFCVRLHRRDGHGKKR